MGSLDLDGGRRGWLTVDRGGEAERPVKRTREDETVDRGTSWGEGGHPGLGHGQWEADMEMWTRRRTSRAEGEVLAEVGGGMQRWFLGGQDRNRHPQRQLRTHQTDSRASLGFRSAEAAPPVSLSLLLFLFCDV